MTSQSITFICSVLLGFCLGAVYDIFRITRIAVKTCKIIVFVEDVVFFAVATIISFIFIVIKNDGMLRGFLLFGVLIGAIIYFFTLSVVVMKIAKVMINFIKSILRFIYKILIKPIIKMILKIKNIANKLVTKIIATYKIKKAKKQITMKKRPQKKHIQKNNT